MRARGSWLWLALYFWVGTVTLRASVPAICAQRLNPWDESVNLTVAANLLRDPAHPSVRLNPVTGSQYLSWIEGPRWQHIPPLFTYVPLPLFAWEGRASVEAARLAFALLMIGTGALFIAIVARHTGSRRDAIAASAASCLWVASPFSRGLVGGWNFGTSDIMLAATVVLALGGLLELRRRLGAGLRLGPARALGIGALAGLPLAAKSVLGGIPAATLAWLALRPAVRDKIGPGARRALACGTLAPPVLEFGWMLLDSPETFRKTVIVPFLHFGDFEGWARPWYQSFVYLMDDYLRGSPAACVALGVALALAAAQALRRPKEGVDGDAAERSLGLRRLLLGWVLANYAAIALVRSKAPNFTYQSWLPMLYLAAHAAIELLVAAGAAVAKLKPGWGQRPSRGRNGRIEGVGARAAVASATLAVAILGAREAAVARERYSELRKALPADADPHPERVFALAREGAARGWNTRSLVVLWDDPQPLHDRYPFLFFTGSEARNRAELTLFARTRADAGQVLQERFDRVHFVCPAPGACPSLPGETVRETVHGLEVVTVDLARVPGERVARVLR